ncbi:MAG: flagellar hook assembly protein FlgD [Clostridia bacterium]
MDINNVSNLTQGASSAQQENNDQIDKEMFLKLLVSQLKHQDPLSPVDNNEFLNQSVQFSTLESIQNLTKDFASMKAMQYLGKSIHFKTGESSLTQSGIVDSVSISEGKMLLNIGEKSVDPKNVIKVDLDE